MVQPLWRTVWKFLKRLKIELPYGPTIPVLGIYLGSIVILKKYPYVHSSTIYNRQHMEATLMHIDRLMDKEYVVHI